ncbi:Carboxylesterase and related proteins [Ceraceosorus bombacis]|uniref:Carboxylesterase and related proteins n=1 Tax=Ceraceosorus bombacis TaxID=401625 RepID=A0A0P1BQ63_9BASI|nr:Carboxylesterase and related proteins [Ceraceosorus bombacis]
MRGASLQYAFTFLSVVVLVIATIGAAAQGTSSQGRRRDVALIEKSKRKSHVSRDVPLTDATLRVLYQNDLDWQRAASGNRQAAYISLTSSKFSLADATTACSALSEQLATVTTTASKGGKLRVSDAGLQSQLNYLLYTKQAASGDAWWTANGNRLRINAADDVTLVANITRTNRYFSLCTQRAPWNFANGTDTSVQWQVTANGDAASWTGYRDAKSFRFQTLPFASAQRFSSSTPLIPSGAYRALDPSRDKQCPQTSGTDKTWAEDCLFTSIYTPVIPSLSQRRSKTGLRPIMVWIYGGGFSSGSGQDFTFDAGDFASRNDVVVVTPNYRLGSLGWLSIDDRAKGNYGISDIISVLQWIQRNIAVFGGDASRVTIAGQSAGAQIVNLLLSSPAAKGLFRGAIVQSSRPSDAANTLQAASTSSSSNALAASVIAKLGCGDASDKLVCLRGLSPDRFLQTSQFSRPVVDGALVRTNRLDVTGKNGGITNAVPTIIGFMRDEMAALGYYPPASQTNLSEALKSAGIAQADISTVVANPENAFPDTGVRDTTVRVQSLISGIARCGQESTIAAAARNNALPAIYAYVQDQRSLQIPNYDPNAVCQAKGGSASSGYYYCHSGDLLTVFGTYGSAFGISPRDNLDITYVNLQMDMWGAFVRNADPNLKAGYLSARGAAYATSLSAIASLPSGWQGTTASNLALLSFGPRPVMTKLGSGQVGKQCRVLGRPLDYVQNGGTPSNAGSSGSARTAGSPDTNSNAAAAGTSSSEMPNPSSSPCIGAFCFDLF